MLIDLKKKTHHAFMLKSTQIYLRIWIYKNTWTLNIDHMNIDLWF